VQKNRITIRDRLFLNNAEVFEWPDDVRAEMIRGQARQPKASALFEGSDRNTCRRYRGALLPGQ
jgi:hypothetical protein